ncbi:hypothetical protein Nepgr_025691 [Nepenthes gracilis]|uniref:Uncharacterized protein n=1 Tax=Nepenthes gracilis TaxID=150966 RepID=A0AAD3XZX6_NEPGR|nr:hypothetical protein Nepgr_025691 [Nepenthes gracilis]
MQKPTDATYVTIVDFEEEVEDLEKWRSSWDRRESSSGGGMNGGSTRSWVTKFVTPLLASALPSSLSAFISSARPPITNSHPLPRLLLITEERFHKFQDLPSPAFR